MTENELLYHKIASDLPNAKKGKLFGANCIKAANGKACVIFWKGRMMFKLNGKDLKEALSMEEASSGTHLYDPNRFMKGWVWISSKHVDRWPQLSMKALNFVKTL